MRKFLCIILLVLLAITPVACSNTTTTNTKITEAAAYETAETPSIPVTEATVKATDTSPTEPSETMPTETETVSPTTQTAETTTEALTSTSAETTTETLTSSPAETTVETAATTPVRGNYLVKVNTAHNCVTIYEKDSAGEYTIPVKAFVCSSGRAGKETPLGTFTTSAKWDWAVMGDGTYTQYVYRFNGPYLFHSVPYFTMSYDNLEYEEFNKLGESVSGGCIRLCARDAKWIYDNVGVGSTVTIYSDESNPGPLGKPDMVKIPLDSPYKGWDPTDPNPNNPWIITNE